MLCKDSWIDISWDGQSSRTKKENLKLQFNKRADFIGNFDKACDQAAIEIYDRYKNLYIGLSGGSDSEYVVDCFARNRIPFTPLIIDYEQYKFPQYELWYAYQWCKRNNKEPKVVKTGNYSSSDTEKQHFQTLKPRLAFGAITSGFLYETLNTLGGYLVTGNQLEYYPDHEQMTYLEPQLGSYQGFVMEESDFYLETIEPNRHPWAFFYWSADVMANFVSAWDTNLTMQENKSAIYKTSPRPKFGYSAEFYTPLQKSSRVALSKTWGTVDCALLGTKEQILSQLFE